VESARVDRWLWAVRVTKTRTDATDLCRGGHVRIGGRPAKAASPVAVGSRVQVRVRGVERDLEVLRTIEKRVGASVAATCFIDHTPPPPAPEHDAAFAVRERGAGRPTKKDRRTIERLRRG
jgi:ribosome-associated heat shock protein Hsp15